MEQPAEGTETYEDLILKLKNENRPLPGSGLSDREVRILRILDRLPDKIENYVVGQIKETDRKWKQNIYEARQKDRELLGSIKAILYKDGWKPPTQVADLLAVMQSRLTLDP